MCSSPNLSVMHDSVIQITLLLFGAGVRGNIQVVRQDSSSQDALDLLMTPVLEVTKLNQASAGMVQVETIY